MTIIRLLITFVYLWSLPLLLGMGTLLFFEKKLDYAKAWFLGFLMHTAIFVSLIRFGIIRGWTNRKIDIIIRRKKKKNNISIVFLRKVFCEKYMIIKYTMGFVYSFSGKGKLPLLFDVKLIGRIV